MLDLFKALIFCKSFYLNDLVVWRLLYMVAIDI